MDIGFIGLGNMGQPMARRLIAAGHKVVVCDTRNDAVAQSWETANSEIGGEADFTTIVQPVERCAGVIVGEKKT